MHIYIYIDCSAGDLGSIPGLGRSLEKEMATHSSILAWRIPWTEELGRQNLTEPPGKSGPRKKKKKFSPLHSSEMS